MKTRNASAVLSKRMYTDVENGYYHFIASTYQNSEGLFDTELNRNSLVSNTVFGKTILDTETSNMIDIKFWRINDIYDEYDHRVDLQTKNFYVITEPATISGDYHVFKCIKNAYGSPSTVKPVLNLNFIDSNFLYQTIDGYIWKYMYSVSYQNFRKFSTSNLFPVIRSIEVEQCSSQGIQYIKIENRNQNRGYETINGKILSIQSLSGFTRIFIEEILDSSGIAKFTSSMMYTDRSFFVEKVIGIERVARLYNILDNGELLNFNNTGSNVFYVDIEDYDSSDLQIQVNDIFSILPKIIIEGDGFGCKAIPILNQDRIIDIEVLEEGNNYRNATAYVLTPSLFDSSACILTPIIQPTGGHGSNPIEELNSANICISITLPYASYPDVQYNSIGLLYDPTLNIEGIFDNRFKITVSDVALLSVGDDVFQTNGAKGVVQNIIGNDIYITNYVGHSYELFTDDLLLNSTIAGSFEITDIVYPTFMVETRLKLTVSGDTKDLSIGDVVTIGGIENPSSSATICNKNGQDLYLVNVTGIFSIDDILDQDNLVIVDINTIYVVVMSGTLVHMNQFATIQREPDTAERFKLVISF